jgi:hypothetical protein
MITPTDVAKSVTGSRGRPTGASLVLPMGSRKSVIGLSYPYFFFVRKTLSFYVHSGDRL